MQPQRILGNNGESLVCEWLNQHHFTILARNYQTRRGEVDIIATKDEVVAFIEVKTRNKEYFPIAQVVTYGKQQRIIMAAHHFILANQLRDKVFRFDIATVIFEDGKPHIEYIPNAFTER
jgi:putative endonuclease